VRIDEVSNHLKSRFAEASFQLLNRIGYQLRPPVSYFG
jgi:hypothetical protein